MIKKIGMLVILFLLVSIFIVPVQSSTPFTVYGYVSIHSVPTNGVAVIVRNINTSESLRTTTLQGQRQDGLFQANLGNLPSSWSRGNRISVDVSCWMGPVYYRGSSSFIVGKGYLQMMNVTAVQSEYSGGGGVALPPAPSANHVPTLSDGGLLPKIGTMNTTFYLNVTYTDVDKEQPYFILAVIDGVEYGMSYVSGDYATGARYTYHTTLSEGYHSYFFYAGDGYKDSYGSTDTMQEPYVLYRPVLSDWSVSPSSGTNDTTFTYSVKYTNRDGIEPVYVHLFVNETQYLMIKQSGDASTGATYQCILDDHPLSPNTYEIIAYDGNYEIRTGRHDGPLVTSTSNNPAPKPNDMFLQAMEIAIGIGIIIVIIYLVMRGRKKKTRERGPVDEEEETEPTDEPMNMSRRARPPNIHT